MRHIGVRPFLASGPLLRILSLLLLTCPPALRAQTPPDRPATIGKVIVQNLDVFDPRVPQYAHFPYPLLNSFHIKTRPGVIRRELLFKSGDPFDRELLEESARNLRKYPFLGYVSIQAVAPGDTTALARPPLSGDRLPDAMPAAGLSPSDTVNVVVTTEDQWTTIPDLVVDRRGNLTRLGIGVEESNFLGFGKYFNLRFLTSTDRNLVRVIYQDPRLLGSHWTFQSTGIKTSEGHLAEVNLARPQFALSDRWSIDTNYHGERGVFRLYESGLESAFVNNKVQRGDASVTRIWGAGERQQKLSLALAGESRTFSDSVRVLQPAAPSAQALQTTGPIARRDIRLETSWALDHFHYVKKRIIDHAGLIEDVKLGQTLSLTAGQALGVDGGRGGYTSLSGAFVASAGAGDNLAVLSLEGGAHIEAEHLNNENFEAFYHHYYQGLPWQTFAFGMAYRRVWNMDQPFQLVLGEDVGLRGYPARQFTGDRLFLLNVEDRIFTPIEFATLRLGFAPFFDAGMVWPQGQIARWDDLRTSIGIGLRLGVVKFAGDPVFRIDVAFPLRRAQNIGRFSIGISFSPIFWAFDGPETVVKRFI